MIDYMINGRSNIRDKYKIEAPVNEEEEESEEEDDDGFSGQRKKEEVEEDPVEREHDDGLDVDDGDGPFYPIMPQKNTIGDGGSTAL